MIYRLKTQDDKLLATVEVGLEQLRKNPNVEIRSEINIWNYSEFLMSISTRSGLEEVIDSFGNLGNLRNWMWDEYFAMKPNNKSSFDEIVGVVKNTLALTALRFDLKLEI